MTQYDMEWLQQQLLQLQRQWEALDRLIRDVLNDNDNEWLLWLWDLAFGT
jgi:hypothetical protein